VSQDEFNCGIVVVDGGILESSGVRANPNLINQYYTKPEPWGIRGLIGGGQGKVATGIGDFLQMMGVTL
jgi:hypothetical protein